ncbi:TPA: glycosyltransferase family 2 protein [Campylobacter jejuni]
MNKTVGVVIPIYNVEKYLKECLDSVINQTYKNLQVVLVNDGSTDENSFNIAKEYTLKDERFILFDKKNGGHSSAENVGIEYFSGEYILKNKTQILEKNSLIEFNIEGNNPYEIYTVYKSYKAFHATNDLADFIYPSIDYIIFLDSDDYWELDCIEKCVPRMNGVNVLWFDYKFLFEIVSQHNVDKTYLERYQFDDGIISSSEWAKRYPYSGYTWFAFIWNGMIKFDFLKNIKLKFLEGVSNIDIHFGTILFIYAKKIYVMNEKVYIYRVRENSHTQYDYSKKSLTPSMMKLYEYFNNDGKKTQIYYRLSSNALMSIEIFNYVKNNICDIEDRLLDRVLEDRIKTTLDTILDFVDEDPYDCIKKIPYSFYVKYINYLKGKLYNVNMSAKERVKNQLSYRLGQILVINSKSILSSIFIPIYLLAEFISYQQCRKNYQEKINKNPNLKLPPLDTYPDFNESLELKNHLSYKLGSAIIKNFKNWYKGGLLILPFDVFRIIKQWKKYNK